MGYRVLEWRNLDVIGFFLYEKSNPKTLQQSHTCATLNCSKVQSKILRKQVRIIQFPSKLIVVIIFLHFKELAIRRRKYPAVVR